MTDAADLIAAVRGFLKSDIGSKLDPAAVFQLKVAANTLGIAEREARMGAQTEAAAHRALVGFLGVQGPYANLIAQLIAAIRSGEARWDDPALLAYLESIAAGKLRIDNPRYHALDALQARSGESGLPTPHEPL